MSINKLPPAEPGHMWLRLAVQVPVPTTEWDEQPPEVRWGILDEIREALRFAYEMPKPTKIVVEFADAVVESVSGAERATP